MKDFICPHCGGDYDIDQNESYQLYNTDDIEEIVCDKCEKPFFVKVHKKFTFETEKEIDDFY